MQQLSQREFPFRAFEVDHIIPAEAAARTTSRTYSCFAPIAIGSRATGRRRTCSPGCSS